MDSPAGIRSWEAQTEPCHMDQLRSLPSSLHRGNAITHGQVFGWQTALCE